MRGDEAAFVVLILTLAMVGALGLAEVLARLLAPVSDALMGAMKP